MNYPISTAIQLRAVLRALRLSRNLSQTEVGHLIGVSQKRVAKIENAPGVTSFDQINRLVTALGGRVVIETLDTQPSTTTEKPKKTSHGKTSSPQGNW